MTNFLHDINYAMRLKRRATLKSKGGMVVLNGLICGFKGGRCYLFVFMREVMAS